MILAIIEISLLIIFGFIFLYLASLSILALFLSKNKIEKTDFFKRIAIVVPAHNEELSLKKTIDNLFEIDYPNDQYNVIVIADNCTDRTADIAKDTGAVVLERINQYQRGKGYALRWCFDQLLNQQPSYDAIAVIDADTVVQKNFLTVLNYYLQNHSEIIQVSDMVAAQPDAWSAEITRLGFALYNFVRPAGRKIIQCSAGIRGNGMCFSSNILRAIPWNTYSLNEDLEYGLILLLNDQNVQFAPETTIFATMPTKASNAESQRSRWENGRFPVIQRYTKSLLLKFLRTKKIKYFDALVELLIPPFVNIFALAVIITSINLLCVLLGFSSIQFYSICWIILLFLGILHVFIGLISVRADKFLFKAIFYIPQYAVWKIILYVKIKLGKRNDEWIRTAREKADNSSL